MSEILPIIPVSRPTLDDATIAALVETCKSGWLGCGPRTTELEEEFAKFVEKKYAVACNSGTAALQLALIAYDIKGGELITTPMTFVSDAIVGKYQGMDVTFSDIDEDSLCMDPESLHITADTRAIIAVHSHGRLADIDGIRRKIASSSPEGHVYDPLIIEDCAHAMWTDGVGKGDIQMYSFQAVKTMPTADGGMLTTNDEEIYKLLRSLRWLNVEKSTYDRTLGRKYTWDYDITRTDGIKAYMNDIQATIALGQLRRIKETLAKRRAIQAVYNDAFKDVPQIKIPMHSETVQYYTMQCDDRDALSEELAEKGIATSVHFKPLSEMTAYKDCVKRPIPVTDRVWKRLLSLPVHDALTSLQQEYIIKCVKDFYHV